jgi:hypothetical protein
MTGSPNTPLRAETLIARQNEGTPFIATRDELKDDDSPLPIDRDIPDLINGSEGAPAWAA